MGAQLAAKYPGLDVTFVVVSFQQGSVIVNTLVLSDPDSAVDAAELIDTFDDAQGEPEFFNSQVVVGDPCMTASCPAESVCSQASPTEHTCVCNAGYAGSDCEDVDECDATPCAHTCSNFAGDLSCLVQLSAWMWTSAQLVHPTVCLVRTVSTWKVVSLASALPEPPFKKMTPASINAV